MAGTKLESLGGLQRFNTALSVNVADYPQLTEPVALYDGSVRRLHDLTQEQAALLASKQDMTRRFQEALAETQRLATVLRLALKHHYGIDSEKLVEFGLQPFRSRPRLVLVGPDGKRVAMILSKAGSPDLWVCNIDGSNLQQLTKTKEDESSPCWSPNGDRICYASRPNERRGLFLISANGGQPTRLNTGGYPNPSEPDWSPDGRQVAFQTRIDGRFQIFTMSLRDRQPRQLTSEGQNEDPSWAPDGRHLVFVSSRSGTRQLWVLDTESGRLRQLTQAGGPRLPAWSPRLGGS